MLRMWLQNEQHGKGSTLRCGVDGSRVQRNNGEKGNDGVPSLRSCQRYRMKHNALLSCVTIVLLSFVHSCSFGFSAGGSSGVGWFVVVKTAEATALRTITVTVWSIYNVSYSS